MKGVCFDQLHLVAQSYVHDLSLSLRLLSRLSLDHPVKVGAPIGCANSIVAAALCERFL